MENKPADRGEGAGTVSPPSRVRTIDLSNVQVLLFLFREVSSSSPTVSGPLICRKTQTRCSLGCCLSKEAQGSSRSHQPSPPPPPCSHPLKNSRGRETPLLGQPVHRVSSSQRAPRNAACAGAARNTALTEAGQDRDKASVKVLLCGLANAAVPPGL